ncbi:hypothetical protein PHAVU_008G273900 [Phaseolus vulgaris]|uniref:Leucine-rich repeat-containing N-terminal plant-type domain-containing protein n=1 Tax=Phaseolus vulgaris TaxID=3885 RepID=V7B901_PHAVU|nr:hypothetical protein PHAVU_008G273900g [Phaseolus vulgaris]ESW14357.1 hypothetical protein PHAVU_008G273900g [Phaseolus vulgaris]
MESWVGWFLLLFSHLFLFHFSFSHSLCHLHDKIALLQFKNSLTYDHDYGFMSSCYNFVPKTSTWKNGTDCCSWYGVTCHPISGHVIGLDLNCNHLSGEIHPNTSLFRLSHIQSLNLACNDIFFSPLSSFLGGFVSLTHLNLSTTRIQGEIPSQISQLSKLETLDLSSNMFLTWKESILKKFLQNTTVLRELILDYVYITSSSMRPLNVSTSLVSLSLRNTGVRQNLKTDIFCLPKLKHLWLSDNSLKQFPNLSCSAASLTILDLSWNMLEGTIPASFSNFTHLTSVDLSHNYLNDSITSSLLTLPHLCFLDLRFNQFSGQIPNVFSQSNKFQELHLSANTIGGELPSTLSNLTHLLLLDLSMNQFSGQIPSSLSNLRHLLLLDLSKNQFSGQIPSSLSNLQHLIYLDLSQNKFSGQIPSSLSNLQHLFHLDLSENRLEGPLPNKITGLSNLTRLSFNDNLLNGTIPAWCLSLPFLQELHLSDNQFTGHIPSMSSQSLKSLYLCYNKLHGNIPPSFFTLVNLTQLCLSSNNFSGLHNTSFFTNINCKFPHLEILYLSSMGLTEFPKLSGKFSMLTRLDLSNNKLNGTVPKWLHEMGLLNFLNLSHNLLETPMNQFLMNYNLEIIDLSFNLLIGGVSSSLCNIIFLWVLILSHNKLTGAIPPCLNNPYILDLQMNKLNGTLPNNFSVGSELIYFNVNDNQLEGPLPKSLSNCTRLKILNLGNNQIEDKFPHWLQTLPMLSVLVLRANKLYGPIEGSKTEHGFSSIIIFDISSNYFNGPIPKSYIQSFKAMKNVNPYKGSQLYMDIPLMSLNKSKSVTVGFVSVTTKAISMTLKKVPKNFVTIDLSQNKFEGQIPYVIGELHALRGLNFSHNKLSGHIPKSIKDLTNLESLDLSSNMLSGRIPTELTNLNFLEVLNLSQNHLVGEIPKGKQFDTFSNDSYVGNSGLCGFPLSMNCNNTEQKSPSFPSFWGEERFGFGWEPVVIGYGCGMIFGIGLGFLYCRKA